MLRRKIMSVKFYRWLAVAAGFAFATTGALQGQTYTYSTFNVTGAAPVTTGSLSVNGINKAGDVVGSLSDTSGNIKGWIRGTKGGIELLVNTLDTTTPSYTLAYGINGYGTVVGIFFDTAANDYPGSLYSSTKNAFGTFTMAGQPAGTAYYVEGVNNVANDYCGSFGAPPNYVYEAFISLAGVNTLFTVDGSTNSGCTGLNDNGAAVGYYVDATGVDHGWYRNPKTGAITVVNAPGASTVPADVTCWGTVAGTVLNGINNSGEISGHFWDNSGLSHGFVVTGGKFIQLDVPGAFQTGGGGINALGQVAGHYSDSSCNNSGFIATPSS
jgi:hypothetical protein